MTRTTSTSALAIGILLTSFAAPSVFAATFSDVAETHRNYAAIEYVVSAGIVSGYSDGTYLPDNTINRAEFTKIIIAANVDATTIASCIGTNGAPFSDVATDAWYAPYVCVAKAKGVTAGYSDGTFRPDKNVTLAEASKMIAKAFGYTVTTNQKVWYKPFIEKLAEQNAIPATVLAFDKEVNRGELAEMIYRIKNKSTTTEAVKYDDLTLTSKDVSITASEAYTGNIAIKEGAVTVGANATVNGNITVVKGSLALGAGAKVTGNVRIVEGTITKDDTATIAGTTKVGRENKEAGRRNSKRTTTDTTTSTTESSTKTDPFASLTDAEKASLKTMTEAERKTFLESKGITMPTGGGRSGSHSNCGNTQKTDPLAALTDAEKESLKTMTEAERTAFLKTKGITMPSKPTESGTKTDPLTALTTAEKESMKTMTEAEHTAFLKTKGITMPEQPTCDSSTSTTDTN